MQNMQNREGHEAVLEKRCPHCSGIIPAGREVPESIRKDAELVGLQLATPSDSGRCAIVPWHSFEAAKRVACHVLAERPTGREVPGSVLEAAGLVFSDDDVPPDALREIARTLARFVLSIAPGGPTT